MTARAAAIAMAFLSTLAAVGRAGTDPVVEFESKIQELRPYEERLFYRPPGQYGVDELALLFHELWILARRAEALAGRAGQSEALKKQLGEMAHACQQAAKAARRASVFYGFTATKSQPYHQCERAESPWRCSAAESEVTGWYDEIGLTPELQAESQSFAKFALEQAELATRRLHTVMEAFPLYRDDVYWRYRPPPRP